MHIRTKHRTWYSFLTNAAVRIGDEVLEVTDDPEHPVYLMVRSMFRSLPRCRASR